MSFHVKKMDHLEIATSFGRCKTTNTVVLPIYKENKENKKNLNLEQRRHSE